VQPGKLGFAQGLPCRNGKGRENGEERNRPCRPARPGKAGRAAARPL